MLERKGLVDFKDAPMTLVGDEIKVGQKGPDFTCLKRDLSEFKLSELDGKIKILSVVPSLDTSVCERQTITFNKAATDLHEDVHVISISVDLPFAQKRFCNALDIDQLLVVSDHKDLDFGYKYGLVMKERRLLARAVVVLDRDNTVRYFKINEQIATEPNYHEVLDVLKTIV